MKVLVHEYREKLDAAKKKCDTPLDAVLREVRCPVPVPCLWPVPVACGYRCLVLKV